MLSISDRIISLRNQIADNGNKLAVLEADIKRQKKEICFILEISDDLPVEKVIKAAQTKLAAISAEIEASTKNLIEKIKKLEDLLNE